MDNYYDIEEPVKGFTIGKLFKWIGIAVILLIYGTLIVRCTLARDDAIVDKVIYDAYTVSVYSDNPDSFSVQQYGMNSAWVAVDEGRLVEFKSLYYMPDSKQLQFGIKYNLDIATFMNEDGIPFKFRLTDNKGNEYDDFFFEKKDKFGYGYMRICFNGIELEDSDIMPDESGILPRIKYTVHIDELKEDGTYFELCKYKLYDGSSIYRSIDFEIK